ncbi:MAG: HAD family hydrolase [Haloferacaceae archaeon]
MTRGTVPEAVTFDLFGTLVSVQRLHDPAAAVASELEERGFQIPDDWNEAYATPHVDVEPGREISLPEHVRAALEQSGVYLDSGEDGHQQQITAAVRSAFDRPVELRSGADAAVTAAVEATGERGTVGVLSNCSIPGLVERTLDRAGLADRFDAVASSVEIGYRKPHPRPFEAAADRLGVDVVELVHVGDNPDADCGIERLGGTAICLDETPLSSIPTLLRGEFS